MKDLATDRAPVANPKGDGSKNGGTSSPASQPTPVHTPTEAPNTLQSNHVVRVIDLLCEGPIQSIKKFMFNGSTVRYSNGNYAFDGVSYEERLGTPDQQPIYGNALQEAETVVDTEVTYASNHIQRTITNVNTDAARVTVQIPALYKYTSLGDLIGHRVKYSVQYRPTGGSWTHIEGAPFNLSNQKNTSPVYISHRFDLTGSGPWDVRVVRYSADEADDSKNANRTIFHSFAEIIDQRILYRNTAYVFTQASSQQFGNRVPTRSALIKGMICEVPSNFNTTTRTYSGAWNGTFKEAWTDCPAWCLRDMILNSRYGLGEYISADFVDDVSLYTISQYCAELVDDGNGGQEHRFTLNCVLQSPQEAYDVVNALTSVFRGMSYWSAGAIMFAHDAPSTPTRSVTRANVVSGDFSYTGVSIKAVHNRINVTWNDPLNNHVRAIATVDDNDHILKYGLRPKDIVAFGCTSEAQAIRAGRWLLYTERLESDVLTYVAGKDHIDVLPGELVSVVDPSVNGSMSGGRLKAIDTTGADPVLTLDREVEFEAGETYEIALTTAERGLRYARLNAPGAVTTDTISLNDVLGDVPENPVDCVWTINNVTDAAVLYRVLNREETEPNHYEITALRHDPYKFTIVENNYTLEERPDPLLPTGPLPVPTNLRVLEYSTPSSGGQRQPGAMISVSRDDDPRVRGVEVFYRRDGQSWNYVDLRGNLSHTFEGLVPQTRYEFYARSYDSLGNYSENTDAMFLEFTGDPIGYDWPVISNPVMVSGIGFIAMAWANPEASDFKEVQIFVGDTDDGEQALSLTRVAAENYQHSGLAPETTKHYFAVVHYHGGFESAMAYLGQGTTVKVQAIDIADDAIEEEHLAEEVTDLIDAAGASAEADRAAAEAAALAADASAIASEAAKDLSETAQGQAQTALTGAQGAEANAQTAQGLAEAAQALSETAASSASSSASLSASYADAAVATLADVGPVTLSGPEDLWSTNVTGSEYPEKPAVGPTYGAFITGDPDLGDCYHLLNTSSKQIGPRTPFDYSPDGYYMVTTRFKVTEDGATDGTYWRAGINTFLDGTLVHGMQHSGYVYALAADGLITVRILFGPTNPAHLNADVFKDTSAHGAADQAFLSFKKGTLGAIYLGSLSVEDVTSEVLARISADASATSEANASASAGAAAASETNSLTAQSASETAATNSENSADDADDSAQAALVSEGAAGVHATAAASSATDADSSASDAATSEEVSARSAASSRSHATGNLIIGTDFEGGDLQGWGSNHFAIADAPAGHPLGRTKALHQHSTAYGYNYADNSGTLHTTPINGRRIRLSGYYYDAGDVAVRVGFRHRDTVGGANKYEYTSTNLPTKNAWAYFEVEETIPATGYAQWNPWLRLVGSESSGDTLDTYWTDIRYEDVTEQYEAEQSATASATDAALASTKADEAGISAAASQTSRVAAEAAESGAAVSAGAAATSEGTATSAASAAASSEALTALAVLDAGDLANNLIRDPNFARGDTALWITNDVILTHLDHSSGVPNADKSMVIAVDTANNLGYALHTLPEPKLLGGRTLRFGLSYVVKNNVTSFQIGVRIVDKDGAFVRYQTSAFVGTYDNDWNTGGTHEITVTPGANEFVAHLAFAVEATGTGGSVNEVRITDLICTDVTDVVEATAQASAALQSANTAAASETATGQDASASAASAAAAATSAGEASASEVAAATSETNAAGSASAAAASEVLVAKAEGAIESFASGNMIHKGDFEDNSQGDWANGAGIAAAPAGHPLNRQYALSHLNDVNAYLLRDGGWNYTPIKDRVLRVSGWVYNSGDVPTRIGFRHRDTEASTTNKFNYFTGDTAPANSNQWVFFSIDTLFDAEIFYKWQLWIRNDGTTSDTLSAYYTDLRLEDVTSENASALSASDASASEAASLTARQGAESAEAEAVSARDIAVSSETSILSQIAATGPSRLTNVESWTNDTVSTVSPLTKALISAADLVTGDPHFGDCYEFADNTNETVGPTKFYPYDPSRVYSVKITARVVTDGPGPDEGELRIGATLFEGTTRDNGEDNQQIHSGENLTSTDGVFELEAWFTGLNTSAVTAVMPSDVLGVGGMDNAPANAANDKIMFHVRQNGNGADYVFRIGSFEVRDITAYVNTLLAEDDAADSAAAASVSEGNAATSETNAALSEAAAATDSSVIAEATLRRTHEVGNALNAGFEAGVVDQVGLPAHWYGDNVQGDAFSGGFARHRNGAGNSQFGSEVSFGTTGSNAGPWWYISKFFEIEGGDDIQAKFMGFMEATNGNASATEGTNARWCDEDDMFVHYVYYDAAGAHISDVASASLSNQYWTSTGVKPLSDTWLQYDQGAVTAPGAAKYVEVRIVCADGVSTSGGLDGVQSTDLNDYKTWAVGNANARIDDFEFSTTSGFAEVAKGTLTGVASAASAAVSDTSAAGAVVSAEAAEASAIAARDVTARLTSRGAAGFPTFSDWDDVEIAPEGWKWSRSQGTVLKDTVNAKYGTAAHMTTAATPSQQRPYIMIDTGDSDNVRLYPATCERILIRAEIEIVSGDWGSSAFRILWDASPDLSVWVCLADMDLPVYVGQILPIELIVDRPDGFTQGGANEIRAIFYSTTTGQVQNPAQNDYDPSDLRVHYMDVSPVQGDSVASIAQSAKAGLDGIQAAAIALRVKAGGTGAELELVALDDPEGNGASSARLAADDILLDGSVKAHMLEIDTSLTMDAGAAAFLMGKDSSSDTNDGIFLGRTDEGGGETGFSFYAGRVDAGREESMRITKDSGLVIKNPEQYQGDVVITKYAVENQTSYTHTFASTTNTITLDMNGGGGGGGGASGFGGSPNGTAGGNGGDYTFTLKDGATVIETWTATGGAGGGINNPETHPSGNEMPYFQDTARGTVDQPIAEYVQLGRGGYGGTGSTGLNYAPGQSQPPEEEGSLHGHRGDFGERVTVVDYDISELTSPILEISTPGTGNGAGGAGGRTGGDGVAGELGGVIITEKEEELRRVFSIPMEPTAWGSFTTQSGTGRYFPDVGDRGLWVVTNLPAGTEVYTGGTFAENRFVEDAGGTMTFPFSVRPRYKDATSGVECHYWFYEVL